VAAALRSGLGLGGGGGEVFRGGEDAGVDGGEGFDDGSGHVFKVGVLAGYGIDQVDDFVPFVDQRHDGGEDAAMGYYSGDDDPGQGWLEKRGREGCGGGVGGFFQNCVMLGVREQFGYQVTQVRGAVYLVVVVVVFFPCACWGRGRDVTGEEDSIKFIGF